MPRQRSRGFCFTYHFSSFNEQKSAEDNLANLATEFQIYQYELCPTTGKVHIQGYLYYSDQVSFSTIHAMCPGIWITNAKGSPAQNIAYCSKESTRIAGPYERGNRPAQGSRSDLAEQLALVRGGMEPMDVIASIPMASKHIKHLMVYQTSLVNRPPNWAPNVFILWGDSGVGKTRYVYDNYTSVYCVTYNKGGAWWDGYANQKAILFDDWPLIEDPNIYYWFLRWLDRYPCNIPFKGGMTRLGTSDIFITHNKDPCLWFHSEGLRALERRITRITNML